MDSKLIEALGLTKEELCSRVVDKIADDLMNASGCDDEDRTYRFDSEIVKQLKERIEQAVTERVETYGKLHVEPNIIAFIEGMSLEQTNEWGERKKDAVPMSFKEYMVKKAEEYVNEKVDFQGKTKDEDSYSWKGCQTRLAHMMHQHLHYHIENAVKTAVKSVNESIGKSIAETVKMKMDEITKGFKVAVGF